MKGKTMDSEHIQTAVNLLLKDGSETYALVRELLAQHAASRDKLTQALIDLHTSPPRDPKPK